MKLIEAYPVEIKIIQYLNENAYINDTAEGALKMVLRWLAEAPAVDPEDLRPQGQWIERVGLGKWICSECQREIYLPFGETPEEIGTNYCPNCGAKMEEQ